MIALLEAKAAGLWSRQHIANPCRNRKYRWQTVQRQLQKKHGYGP